MRSISSSLICAFALTTPISPMRGEDATPKATEQTIAAEKAKPCFQCQGTGEMKCDGGCQQGMKACPAPCLKLTVGVWEKRNVPGHTDPNERWQTVRVTARKSVSVSSGHLGEVLVLGQDGNYMPVKCKVCGGTTTVTCPRCKGKGSIGCTLCGGKKTVSESWTAFDHPKMKNRPKKFQLRDGRTLIGRDVAISGDTVTIRTETGDVRVNQKEIISQESQKTFP
jgi:hypothetical protein